MKTHRFIGDFDLSKTDSEINDKKLIHQISNVLHLQTGEKIILCDGKGSEALAIITGIDRDKIAVKLDKAAQTMDASLSRTELYCALLKKENFELAAQKAAEVGVTEIIPLLTDKTVKKNFKPLRVQKILHEAAEQSGRATVPHLREITSFKKILKALRGTKELNIFLDSTAEKNIFAILKPRESSGAVRLFIGPEGGWSDDERAAAKNAGFVFASLGDFTLRGETAAIIASYLAANRNSGFLL